LPREDYQRPLKGKGIPEIKCNTPDAFQKTGLKTCNGLIKMPLIFTLITKIGSCKADVIDKPQMKGVGHEGMWLYGIYLKNASNTQGLGSTRGVG
jgi:hypothetical protein